MKAFRFAGRSIVAGLLVGTLLHTPSCTWGADIFDAPRHADGGPREKPPTFDDWLDRLDYIHNNFHWWMHSHTRDVDRILAGNLEERVTIPDSRFRVGFYTEFVLDNGLSFRFDPAFDAEVELPNAEKNLLLFITGSELDEFPATEAAERDGGLLLGLRRHFEKMPINMEAGVRVRWRPEAFSKARWNTVWRAGNWAYRPSQQVFYETEEGFGEITAMSAQAWYGRRKRGFLRSNTSVRWTESTEGIEWEQDIGLERIDELMDEGSRGKWISRKHTARGVGLRLSVFGHKTGSGVVDRYRLTLLRRRPLYKRWVYFEFAPEIQWKNENDWREEFLVRTGIETFFWGTETR